MALVIVFLTCLRHYLQRIYIEKLLSIQRHAADHAVIQSTLHYICIPSVFGDLQHTSGKKDQADGSTGLSINGIVWKVIIKGKCLSMLCGADSSCHIHLPVYNIVPEFFTGLKKSPVFCSGSNLSHSCIKINSSHCMPLCLVLVTDRLSRLVILLFHIRIIPVTFVPVFPAFFIKKQGLPASLVNKVFGQLQVPLIFCNIIQGAESHLRYFMAGISGYLPFFCSQMFINTVGVSHCNIQKLSLAGCLIISHCRLGHMSQAVQFMVVHQVGKSFLQTVNDIVGIQIAVRLLSLSDKLNSLVCRLLQLTVRMPHQGPGHCL